MSLVLPDGTVEGDATLLANLPSTQSRDRLVLHTGRGEVVRLENFWNGEHCFLMCSGPSLCDLNLTRLDNRGVFVAGINNSWMIHRPDIMICADNPGRFLDAGWKDPGVLKFCPLYWHGYPLRVKENGKFRDSRLTVEQAPGVFFYMRNEHFRPDQFLWEQSVNWGVHRDDADSPDRHHGSMSVMLIAMRLLYHLGFRQVYLIGCDFEMREGAHEQNYAFKQGRTDQAVGNNNRAYAALERRFTLLRPVFEENGLFVYNCNPDSKLKVFPFLSYDTACSRATARCDKSLDTEDWYTIAVNGVRK